MNSSCNRPRLSSVLVAACLLGGFLSGCTVVGPATVLNGRLAYNEAILKTDNQQMLLLAVQNRYGERSNLLAVASVTANVRIATRAGIEVGVGDKENYSGGLVPFSAGVAYEENPTISYTPVGGDQYARQLLSPLSVALLAQLIENLVNPAPIYYALISSINGVHNLDFLSATSTPDMRFSRVVKIMTTLSMAHRLRWIQQPQRDNQFAIVIDHYAPDYTGVVNELLTLLQVPAPENSSSRIVLPISQMLDEQETGGIVITTRSVFNLLGILSGAVDVPEKDQADGVAMVYPPPGLAGERLQVQYSKNDPEHVSVAIQYRDGWFYIDERDQATKQFFRLMATLLSVNIADSVGRHAVPVLTVPVSR